MELEDQVKKRYCAEKQEIMALYKAEDSFNPGSNIYLNPDLE